MKLASIIFSLLFIALSCLPCADGADDCAASPVTEKKSSHPDGKSADTCSPFCICNCCSVQVINPATTITFELPVPAELISREEPFYKSHFISSFSGSIWQPPQLV
ncbi:DUF6660 family protein [Flavobacterium magnum]|uniref:DUF6660 family protein n=1 Tax=Flavobacterium magnum TaxID=2162713 RepID=UPI00318418A5